MRTHRNVKNPPYLVNMEGKVPKWLQKLGWAGFLFFLIKGLIWLGVFYGLGNYLFN